MNQEICQPESQDFSPEEQAFMEKEYANQPRIEDAERCRLPASGFTETLSPVYDWAKTVVRDLQAKTNGQKIAARLWAYREQYSEWLALDFFDGIEANITFLIGEPHNYYADLDGGGTVNVPDMTEALHMVGIICHAINVEPIDIVLSIGNRQNEVNPYCTPSQRVPGQTSAPLKIVGQATNESLLK
ncbi:hypothetical protein [Polynucleobacter sp. Fuers-14]|uniref:hypothetical protein n=1 Tax=Polynucleobacter sp. Fuers-14 TaxID=1758364 RepID=UPI001C0D97FC|nr:hypothetical protein [Polynucleobacter sp. Fuers-14]MBU3640982.1 hypothetical protein [Polynucleobacter sp. Fuers-14]